jgi:hypothetical protein
VRNLLCLIAALVVILSFACGKSAEKTAEKALEKSLEDPIGDGAEVDVSDQGMTITSEDEKGAYTWQAGDEAKIPDSFPKDVHVYERAAIQMSSDSPEGITLVLATDDPISKVVATYEEKMVADGWTKQTSSTMSGTQMLIYTKGDRGANVGVFDQDGSTQISLTLSK